jgi:hypothetical protein
VHFCTSTPSKLSTDTPGAEHIPVHIPVGERARARVQSDREKQALVRSLLLLSADVILLTDPCLFQLCGCVCGGVCVRKFEQLPADLGGKGGSIGGAMGL